MKLKKYQRSDEGENTIDLCEDFPSEMGSRCQVDSRGQKKTFILKDDILCYVENRLYLSGFPRETETMEHTEICLRDLL